MLVAVWCLSVPSFLVAVWCRFLCLLASVCKKSVSVWVKGGKAWSLRRPNQKNSDLAVVSVCVYLVFHCEWVWCVVVSAFWQRVVCVMKSGVCHCVGAKWFSWVVRVCVSVGWVLLAVQVWKCAGGERCVDLETQKEGKKSIPKGREAEVTSTVSKPLLDLFC